MNWSSKQFVKAAPVPVVVDRTFPYWGLFPMWAFHFQAGWLTIGQATLWWGLN